MATALGSVWLKHTLEHPRTRIDDTEDGRIQPKSSLGIARPVLVLALSFAAGLGIGFIGQADELRRMLGQVMFFAFTIVSFFTLVLFHRRSRSGLWLYQLDSIVLWAAFMSGNYVGMQRLDSDFAGGALVFWFGFLVVGGIIILATRPRRRRSG